MAAFRRRGLTIAGAKVGPDFIDPGYHSLATGRPGRNLDPWMMGSNPIASMAAKAGKGCDLLIVEGVMGLFDGSATPRLDDGVVDPDLGSTAQVARLIGAPVLLVVDAASASRSLAALVHGFTHYDVRLRIGGLILNRLGSDHHEAMVTSALAEFDIPIMGALRRDDALTWRDRHLGLVPVIEHPTAVHDSLDRLSDSIGRACDLGAIEALARGAYVRHVEEPPSASAQADGKRARIAVVTGAAFSFSYPDNLEMLEQAGAELIPLNPFEDVSLPDQVCGLVAGGGFPEVFAAELSANTPLLNDIRTQINSGLVTWAECGGMLWLANALDAFPMAGVIPTNASMGKHLTLGYRRALLRLDSPIGSAGEELWGHEFHYSTVDENGAGMTLFGRTGTTTAGWVTPTMVASYLHLHLGAAPHVAEHFVRTCSQYEGVRSRS